MLRTLLARPRAGSRLGGQPHVFRVRRQSRVELTLYTDALITRGFVRTHQRRVTDILNHADQPFLVLEDVTVEELGVRTQPIRSEYAQVNLDSVLFAVANEPVEADRRAPNARSSRSRRSSPSRRSASWARSTCCPRSGDLREALTELTGRFIPVTDATFWSDRLGEARQVALDGRGQPPSRPDPCAAPRARPVGWPGQPGRRPPGGTDGGTDGG